MRQFILEISSSVSNGHATLVLCGVLALLVPAGAHSETWEYQSYPDGVNTTRPLDKPLAPGYIRLDESGEKPMFMLFAGKVTECFSGAIEAEVERTIETTIITVRRDLRDCSSARFVIRNDGTGGRREVMRGGTWAWDGPERGLKPKKP
jgi:hypothetical protein